MRRFEQSTFVFISTNAEHAPGGVEERWLPVMQELAEKGAGVRFLCLMHTPMGEWARTLPGVEVDPYILDMWNVIRARSRLRKYLKRYVPVCAHSTGVEADLLLRWAARKVPEVKVAHTLTDSPQGTRRRRPIDRLMRRYDELGMRTQADAVFVNSQPLVAEVVGAGVPAERVMLELPDESAPVRVARHLDLYRSFMAERGQA
jgi:hypothetical protein